MQPTKLELLKKYGVRAHYKPISYEKHQQPDGLFIAWEGVKIWLEIQSSLCPTGGNYSEDSDRKIIDRVKWTDVLMEAAKNNG